MEKQVCGARTRKGTACQKAGIGKNGRCRHHGGLSTGPRDKARHSASLRGNKNALKTGEYESIYHDTLSEDEKSLVIPEDAETRLKQQIDFQLIRCRRLAKRYEQAQKTNDDKLIYKLEEAFSRIEGRMCEFERQLAQLQAQTTNEEDGSLDQLCGILNGIREIRQERTEGS
ncbi:hypothetical protein HUC00_28680 [Bacillus mycoides]|nr:hypothetical protein [Bacillus mycoides]